MCVLCWRSYIFTWVYVLRLCVSMSNGRHAVSSRITSINMHKHNNHQCCRLKRVAEGSVVRDVAHTHHTHPMIVRWVYVMNCCIRNVRNNNIYIVLPLYIYGWCTSIEIFHQTWDDVDVNAGLNIKNTVVEIYWTVVFYK